MKLKTTAFAISILIGSASLMSGCASSGGGVSMPQASPTLVVQYSNPADKDALNRAGMLNSFIDYWQSHLSKDWSHRYDLEKFSRPVDQKFYTAYHANAWPIRLLQVTGVNLTEQDATVNITLTFFDPEKKRDILQYEQNKWTRVNGSWLHIASDPMLSGFSQ